jgi:hypothetical protein
VLFWPAVERYDLGGGRLDSSTLMFMELGLIRFVLLYYLN